jgi:high-affinity iron transporter
MQFMLLFLSLILSFSISITQADSRLIIHLSDYLANDYAGAVGEDGSILSEGEYNEQVEFSQTALRDGQSDPLLKSNTQLQELLLDLSSKITTKAPPSVVVPLARAVQNKVIEVSGIKLSPSLWPDYKKAQALYASRCVSCHGQEGRGDGPDGSDLEPKPSNFHDPERAPLVSPFAAYNTIRLGVPGTGMLAHPDLSDDEVWGLAFYVNTFRFGKPQRDRGTISEKITNEEILTAAASLNDPQLREFLIQRGESPDLLEKIRLYSYDAKATDYLVRAQNFLDQSLKLAQAGDFRQSEKLSLDAYFSGIEPVENKINANDPTAVTRLEGLMAAFRKAIKNQDIKDLTLQHTQLSFEIKAIDQMLSGYKVTPIFAFASGFSIILREGFEAVLVILAILGVAKASGSALVSATIHSGWIVSLILGVIGWFLSGILISMSGVDREIMEAAAAFFAVFVLLYVGFWMHRQTEVQRWKEFIGTKVKNLAQTKNLLGLFILSFVVTFREVFETVLFLRTIYIETEEHVKIYIFSGVMVAFAVVMVISIMITRFRNRIPLQKFFAFSSMIMMVLATILAGKGIHALQEAGVVPMAMLPFKIRLELLGIFPSWQTLLAQLLVLGMSVIIWKRAGRRPNPSS